MKTSKLLILFFIMACCLTACHDNVINPDKELSLDYYSTMATDSFALNSRRIRQQIEDLRRNDNDSMVVDFRVKEYYSRKRPFLWIDRHGVNEQADSLVACLDTIATIGLSPEKFRLNRIKKDLDLYRKLNFDTANTINKVAARLEYNLTKAYLRYVTGQRIGFVNPNIVLNQLDTLQQNPNDEVKWTTVHYRQLFDLKMDRAGKHFYEAAFDKVSHDSVGTYLREVEPRLPMYRKLLALYRKGNLSLEKEKKVLCNLERCRWRLGDYPWRHQKYVLVNIPSLHLFAVDGDNVLTMRVGCGTHKTKTPLLYSSIYRMDINPQWIMPRSIVTRDVVRHVGERSWFENNHYFVRDKKTGERVPFERVTRQMILDPNYMVVQEGGEGNSLGRIIFRFNNDFSIYLHSTSQQGVFSQKDRQVSHGCIRVEKPYELARFMLENKDEDLLDKIRYSMTADVSDVHKKKEKDKEGEEKGETGTIKEAVDTLDRSKLLGALKVAPKIPVFIMYYTLYQFNGTDGFTEYPDIYGYDNVIWDKLQNYR